MEIEDLSQEQKDNNFRTNNWAFTVNNPSDDDRQLIDVLGDQITYMIIGNEIGKCGTPHIQGCLNAKNKISFKQLKKFLPRAHIAVCIKSLSTNISYCKKDADYKEYGQPPTQGKRNDLKQIKEKVLATGSIRKCLQEDITNYQQYKMAEVYLKYFEPERRFQPEIYWFCGQSGKGKTETAYNLAKDMDVYTVKCQGNIKWWDGYDAHEVVILDDMRPSDFKCGRDLVDLIKNSPYKVETKGGSRQLLAKKMYITTPYKPSDFMTFHTEENPIQITRRVKEIQIFGDYSKIYERNYED